MATASVELAPTLVRFVLTLQREDEENPWMKYKLTHTNTHTESLLEKMILANVVKQDIDSLQTVSHTELSGTVLDGVFGVLAVVHPNGGRGCGWEVF